MKLDFTLKKMYNKKAMKTIEKQKLKDVLIKCRIYIQDAYNDYPRNEVELLNEIDSLNICDHDYQFNDNYDCNICVICNKKALTSR